jgi:hypothetical protein
MRAGVAARQGQLPPDVARWLGAQEVAARVLDVDRDGVPERVTWTTTRGEVVQVWYDRGGDGVADRVEFFENGRRVRVIGQ